MLDPVRAREWALQATHSPIVDHIVLRAPLGWHPITDAPTAIVPRTGTRMWWLGWRRHLPNARARRWRLGVPGSSGVMLLRSRRGRRRVMWCCVRRWWWW